mmetsp:Transcript_19248/g.28478  ORF Transcript_19248/g.28478 Transcript_19248/m.28478 type:complete len:392 (+) Transcript_19248:51-1226(+)|eukprot:CAMPEP_0194201008 /NCGR_PEP_ID=MMETSP0156-20130528/1402_1 /TAXON_ID=33649 /ORGANISM="Thalassionema nitzschioides, Strain L26-B" /LENGTH=391 /DNA_ID=CAMNT_0038926095 /DNA_START=32 /DNA_END=1207 /DNA_ORIENTATION=-
MSERVSSIRCEKGSQRNSGRRVSILIAASDSEDDEIQNTASNDEENTSGNSNNDLEIGKVTSSKSFDSVDSNFEQEEVTMSNKLRMTRMMSMRQTMESERYDAVNIRAEFKAYQHVLPKPQELLQGKHSFQTLRKMIEGNNLQPPRFLQYNTENGIKPHHALCNLLLTDYEVDEDFKLSCDARLYSLLVRTLSFGKLDRQIHNPAEFIRDQFSRIAEIVPASVVKPPELRKKIMNRGLTVPNYFLAPEDGKQFPPHIALLVLLQDGEKESQRMNSRVYHLGFSLYAFVALFLRIVLEVIGGAGAIWGGAEVFTLRTANNLPLWRWISVGVGIFCILRFCIQNLPQQQDLGDTIGPAGPWSLPLAARLRAVCDHPFHYFVRAKPPPVDNKDD